MFTSTVIIWEDRLTRLSFAFLLLATVYGIGAGAAVAMYYDITPNMDSVEDVLASFQFILFLLAVFIGFAHLPMLVPDLKHKLWEQALVRAAVFASPLIIYLGTEGLISHSLWWAPISDTDRFHMLHHTVIAGAPLTFGYWLVLRHWWRPATFSATWSPSLKSWLVTGIVLVLIAMVVGMMMGLVSPPVFGLTVALGLVALPIIWRVAG